MIKKNQYKNVTWIDLENPSAEEVRDLVDQYDIDPIIGDELLTPTVRPLVDIHERFIYLILHFPLPYSDKGFDEDSKKTQEIDFILGKDFIITTRYDEVDALHRFSKVFEVDSILDKSNMDKHAGYIFFYMIQYLYKNMLNKVENIRDLLADTESKIFKGKEKYMVSELSKLNRLLLTFKEAISNHKEVLVSFELAAENFFGRDFKYYLRSAIGEYYKVSNSIENTKEYLNELKATNDSLLSSKQNEVMKILTVMAFITFPLSLIAGIFGMNTVQTPILGHPLDFWIIITIMLSLTMLFFIYFKFKDWI